MRTPNAKMDANSAAIRHISNEHTDSETPGDAIAPERPQERRTTLQQGKTRNPRSTKRERAQLRTDKGNGSVDRAIAKTASTRTSGIENLIGRIGEKIDTLLDILTLSVQVQSVQANALRLRKNVLTFEEACLYLDLSESHLYKLTADGTVPHSKPNGKKLYFGREELDAWLMSNPVKTRADIEREAATYCMQYERNKNRSRRNA